MENLNRKLFTDEKNINNLELFDEVDLKSIDNVKINDIKNVIDVTHLGDKCLSNLKD